MKWRVGFIAAFLLTGWAIAQINGGVNGASGGGLAGVSSTANGENGYTVAQTPVSLTGINAQAANSIWSFGSQAFTGNYYSDPVSSFGYNVDAGTCVNSNSIDIFCGGYFSEGNYEYAIISSTATSVSGTTVINDTSQSLPINAYVGWTIYVPSLSASSRITANTATQFTFSPALTGLTGTPTYQVLIEQAETYIEWGMKPSGGSTEEFRPWFFTFDRGTAQAQAALGTEGAISVTSISTANPAVVTTSSNHGLQNGSAGYRVRFASLSGGTWSTLNGIALSATPTGSTTFTIPVNGSTFGGSAESGGTVKEDPFLNTSNIMAAPSTGLNITLPCWNQACLATTDLVASFTPQGLHQLNGYEVGQDYLTFNTTSGTSAPSGIILTYSGSKAGAWFAQGSNVSRFFSYYAGTAVQQIQLFNNNDTADAFAQFGTSCNNLAANGTLMACNYGGAASNPVLQLQGAASQSGDYLDVWQSNGTTKQASITSTGLVTSMQSTAPSSTAAVGIQASSTASLGIYFGSGAPTFSAAEGSIYSNTSGAAGARLYVNTNGSTTWVAATSP